jgi:hypothetical protein
MIIFFEVKQKENLKMFIKNVSDYEKIYRLDNDFITTLESWEQNYREFAKTDAEWQQELEGLKKNGLLKDDLVIIPKGSELLWVNPDDEISFILLINGKCEEFMTHNMYDDELPALVGARSPYDED